ncbi:MAG: zinc ribbon domain-containing protein [Candidatus Kaelpia aquatica]|nr:zinc ribbon domain-containing protein [Candidatus Kaelpia aquatica]
MPTYEYECRKCGIKFDKFQNMSDKLLSECPECGGEVKRLIGKGAGIIFKGSGFYATDHRKPEPKKCCDKDGSCDGPPCSTSSEDKK